MDYIEFQLNGRGYWAGACNLQTGFCWGNDLGEEGKVMPTLLAAQQDAIDWESCRKERARQAVEDENHVLWQRQHNESLRGPL